jgi:hypothetical protein
VPIPGTTTGSHSPCSRRGSSAVDGCLGTLLDWHNAGVSAIELETQMPAAKKPTRSPAPRTTAQFKEPVALKWLSASLDTAHAALTELRQDAGRDVSDGARELYKDLRTFISSARRNSGKLATALRRDFE